MDEGWKQIGIMGGTFDPVHKAHLALAEQAYRQFSLDEVWMMPNGRPPHKRDHSQADVSHRMEMVRRAIAEIPYLRLCGLEQFEMSYHYTFETIHILKDLFPKVQFYFIMGADSLFQFEHWKGPEEICRLATLVVAVRDHVSEKKLDAQILHLKEILGARIEKLDTPNIDISSETLRSWIASGHSLRYYVPNPVISYIEEQRIYSRN